MKLKYKIFFALLLFVALNVATAQTIVIGSESFKLSKTAPTLLRNIHFSGITKFKLNLPNSKSIQVRFGPFNVKDNPDKQSISVWCDSEKNGKKTLRQYDKTTLSCRKFYIDTKKISSLKVLILEIFGGTEFYLIEIYPD